MEVKLLTPTTLIKDMEQFAAIAALTCHGNADKDFVASDVLARIIKLGHESILEHITLTYSVKELSRACLQELARHRHITLSVESTRHTLHKQLSDEFVKKHFPYGGGDFGIDYWKYVEAVHFKMFAQHHSTLSNDQLKYFLPEFWPTNLIMTVNVRELRHILDLRTAPTALKEFRDLAHELYEAVPPAFQYLLADCVHEEVKPC